MKKILFIMAGLLVIGSMTFVLAQKNSVKAILSKYVKRFDAGGGQIFIINNQSHNVKEYKIGESAFYPLELTANADCFHKAIYIRNQKIDTYSCTNIKDTPKQVETIAFADISAIKKDYEIWVVLNEPKPKKYTFGFVTAPWNALPLLNEIIALW